MNLPTRCLGWAFVLGPLTLASCDEEQVEDDHGTADIVAVEQTSATLGSSPLLTYVAELFQADATWGDVDPAVVPNLAVVVTKARIELVLESLQCTTDFETDNETYLSGTFDNCGVSAVALQGDFHATLEIETEACDEGSDGCFDGRRTLATSWLLDGPGITVGITENESASFAGPVVLRDTVDRDAPMTWATQPGFRFEAIDGVVYQTRSNASWIFEPATNCLTITTDVRIELPSDGYMDERLDEAIFGEIAVSGEDVHYCPSMCPTRGEVDVSYGQGRILSWTYNGTDTVDVVGPRGRSFPGKLDCQEPGEPSD